ncbi:MAG: cobalamin-dependent protein [Sulfurimonadaceae bacterium]|nr:cobalamin-dependent protein [Sulfurimonadaceae bacterium]
MEEVVSQFEDALLSLDRIGVKKILDSHLTENPIDSLEQIVVPAMENIGVRWEKGEVALSQIYMGGRISEEVIFELLEEKDVQSRGDSPKLAIVLYRDYHGLGKRIVHTLLLASGYQVDDYDRLSDPAEIVSRAESDGVDILLVSTLMLNSALHIRDIIDEIRNRGLNMKVVVGGAPFRFDKELYKEIGADAMGTNASDILRVIPQLKEQS